MRWLRPLVATTLLLAAWPGSDQSLLAQAPPDRAADVLAAARAAMGGDARSAGVKTFIATGQPLDVVSATKGGQGVPIDRYVGAHELLVRL